MRTVMKVDLQPVNDVLKQAGLEDGGAVQKQIDESFLRYCDPYLPFDSGMLRDSGITSTKIGSGQVVWDTPYAHYLYEGILYVDPYTGKGAFFDENYGFWSRPNTQKVPSDRELLYHGGGLQGKKWAERMWADHGEDIIREATAVANQGGR